MLARRFGKAYSGRALAAGALALAVLLWLLWMQFAITVWPAPYWFEHNFARTVDSPSLALAFARNRTEAETVFQVNNAHNPDPEKTTKAERALQVREMLACFYVPLCAAYLFLFGLCYQPNRSMTLTFGTVLALWVLVGWGENALLLTRGLPTVALAVLNWLLLAGALLVTGALVLGRRPGPYATSTRRLLAVTHFAASALIAGGLCFAQLPWVSLGGSLFTATVVFNLVGLVGPLLTMKAAPQLSDPHFCEKRRARAQSSDVSGHPSGTLL